MRGKRRRAGCRCDSGRVADGGPHAGLQAPVTEAATAWHPLSDLRGVGPVLADQLAGVGYHYCEDLLGGDPHRVAVDVGSVPGLTAGQALDELIPLARLLRLAIPRETALDLFDRGLRSYQALLWISPGVFSRGEVTVTAVEVVLEVARRLDTGTLMLSVQGSDGSPVPGATVEAVNPTKAPWPHAWQWTTNEHGCALCEYLDPARRVTFVVSAPRHAPATLSVLPAGRGQRLRVDLAAGDGSAVTVDEAANGVSLPDHGTPIEHIELGHRSALDHVDTFLVSEIRPDGIRLTSLLWYTRGAVTVQESATWPTGDLPVVDVGTVVQRSDDGFTVLSVGWRMWRAQQRRRVR